MMETFLAAKEQIHICGSMLDEELAWRWFRQKDEHSGRIQRDIAEKSGIIKQWMNTQDDLEWIEPRGGVVCFPRMKRPLETDIDKFYKILLHKYGTYTGPGHWFEWVCGRTSASSADFHSDFPIHEKLSAHCPRIEDVLNRTFRFSYRSI